MGNPLNFHTIMHKSNLRRLLRKRRQALTLSEQTLAAQKLCEQLETLPVLSAACRVGLYFPSDGEISPLTYARAHREHKYYLPSLCTQEKRLLHFHPWQVHDPIIYNHLKVAEPANQNKTIAVAQLDVILMPLVGFNHKGVRLGMGGGFYDYTLRNLKQGNSGPLLIGIAHACQYYETLHEDPWDIPLNAVVTDQETLIFPQEKAQ